MTSREVSAALPCIDRLPDSRGVQRLVGRGFVFAIVVAGCGSTEGEPTYGSIVLEMRAHDGDAEATFGGTATIVATVGYGTCIEEFYREHEDDVFTGPDGEATVDEWTDRLCDEDEGSREEPLACEVAAIEQSIEGGPSRLVVTFAVMGAVDGREAVVGPFPDAGSSACTGGALPGLHVGADAVRGLDGEGNEIWTAQPDAEGLAVVDQAEHVVVFAVRVPPV